jgi:Iron-containing redox enzyme
MKIANSELIVRKSLTVEEGGVSTISSNSTYYPALHENSTEMSLLIQSYAANPLFQDVNEWIIHDNPYRRPLRPQDLKSIDFNLPLRKDQVLNYSALAAHRMLLNIYENDLVFLPEDDFAGKKNDFNLFYSNENKLLGEFIRPTLEAHIFGFLNSEIDVSGQWSIDDLKAYFGEIFTQDHQSGAKVADAILASSNSQQAAILLLIQVASNFLLKSSPLARNVLGTYGSMLSEMFKIIIDEYGYGVHRTKYSTLFENTMVNCGLLPHVHSYWQFYLSSWLALINYFHLLSRDHSKLFKFIGVLVYTEATLGHTCRLWSKMMCSVFGSNFDTTYFNELTHMSEYHGRIAFDNLIMPAIAKYGNSIIEDIVQGIEKYRLLQEIADRDFIEQLNWSEQIEKYKLLAQRIALRICNQELQLPKKTLIKSGNELSVTCTYDEDQLLVVESGVIRLINGYNQFISLQAKEAIIIPRNRLNGSVVRSDECTYHIYSLGDYKAWLS